jgi:nucleoid-associated protein YgaU
VKDPFTAPFTRPAAPPEPKRDSYLEEQYRWRPGDSFAAISTQFYKSPNYADALLKYNQDYPLATREMRQNPPALAPGQIVWVPPPRILERDYANLIGGLTPIATPTSRPTVEPVTPPPGLANSGFAAPAEKLYRVRQTGESVQEIARRTLRNSAFANRIQALNPSLSADPRLPIPAGTVLRLPGDATVDAADRP